MAPNLSPFLSVWVSESLVRATILCLALFGMVSTLSCLQLSFHLRPQSAMIGTDIHPDHAWETVDEGERSFIEVVEGRSGESGCREFGCGRATEQMGARNGAPLVLAWNTVIL